MSKDTKAEPRKARILNIDCETSPNRAYTFNQIIEPGRMLCFAARWHGEDEIIFRSEYHDSADDMIEDLWNLLDEADAVMGWNSASFDVKHINREFIERGLLPPTDYKHIDLLKVVRKNFRFASNKLDFVAQRLDLGNKLAHTGFQLWRDALAGDAEAWALMKEYNIQDVQLVEDAYELLLPWINVPTLNLALFSEAEHSCPRCGCEELTLEDKRARTGTAEYDQYRCDDCGYIARSGKKSKRNNGPVLR
jgi:DNA polymerase III epsilon subunit-like protein/predicted RNA-binding Zn-ribbon protein involved in translation (DUF1610 family)